MTTTDDIRSSCAKPLRTLKVRAYHGRRKMSVPTICTANMQYHWCIAFRRSHGLLGRHRQSCMLCFGVRGEQNGPSCLVFISECEDGFHKKHVPTTYVSIFSFTQSAKYASSVSSIDNTLHLQHLLKCTRLRYINPVTDKRTLPFYSSCTATFTMMGKLTRSAF
jgi:hypothetical protein